jgi:hypothetical protein
MTPFSATAARITMFMLAPGLFIVAVPTSGGGCLTATAKIDRAA